MFDAFDIWEDYGIKEQVGNATTSTDSELIMMYDANDIWEDYGIR